MVFCEEKRRQRCFGELLLQQVRHVSRIQERAPAGADPQEYDGHGFMDFCYIGDNEDHSDQCWISLMKQKAHLKLDEKGTEAAAVTVIGMSDGMGPSEFTEFIADRPFLYVISERSTGSIFFIGQYMGEPLENPRHDICLTEEEQQLVKSNNDFAFRLFSKVRGGENRVISPLSITYALGMMNNGAAGLTQPVLPQDAHR